MEYPERRTCYPDDSCVALLLQVSDYATRQAAQLHALVNEDDCQQALSKQDYQQLIAAIPLDLSASAMARALRHFRHRHLLRLLLRELANLADTRETMAAWSDCADVMITRALHYCEHQLSARFGKPRHESGEPAELYVMAMGKLGGQELNFSSDIDLIMAYTAAGCTNGAESVSNQEYYTKVVQHFMQLLQNVTADGFVFRVDLRLRPNGESGPLVCTLLAMENYYQEQGRDWERYAMVKARLIDADDHGQQWLNCLIKPFVYRRYVDYSVIESLRSMKAMIEREIQINPMLDDIKRGQGGIREVEFVIQCFQLIRGGRLPNLQQQNALLALFALKQEGLLAHSSALRQGYLFLRKLENALQMLNDQQTHTLPADSVKQKQIVLVMGYETWNALLAKLHQYQRIISNAFHAVLGKVDSFEDETRLVTNQLASLWQGHVESTMAINLLASLGFQNAERCYQMIHAFRHSPRCRHLTQASRMRLDRFMVLLLAELMHLQSTDVVLLNVLHLLENIVGRSAYLALLTENPHALQALLHLFAHSPFITTLLVSHPFLLEVLLDQDATWRPPSRTELKQRLQKRLAHCEENELQDEILRQFKLTCWLLVARAELSGQCDAVRAGRFLSDVAAVIIAAVVTSACQQLSVRYPEIMGIKSRFAIIAYGKLGSREMNYDSDIDLVFLHKAHSDEERLVTRLTQKILCMLTTRSAAGVLYSVDTRLRPSGAAGLLVSHIDSFVDYQRTQAWTWEHQALMRARIIVGNTHLKRAFNQLNHDVLFMPRNTQTLREDVQGMREKIDKYSTNDSIKYSSGGLLDLEFLVQFLLLAHPHDKLARATHTLSQLQHLYTNHVLSQAQFKTLEDAYRHYHHVLHRQILQLEPVTTNTYQQDVLEIMRLF